MTTDAVFLGRVSHDLRGELATMVAGIHYVLRYEPELGAEARSMLERVSGAGQRLRRLIDELENAGWIDGGDRGGLALETCSAGAVLDGVLGRIAPTAEGRGVALAIDVPALWPPFEGDAELLGVALGYALDFAVSRSKGMTVRVRGDVEEGAPTVEVTDEGGEVAPAKLAGLFEPFAEKDLVPREETGFRRERLGLGLSIAAGILRAHGGSLRAEPSSSGRGITLRCTLARPVVPLRRLA